MLTFWETDLFKMDTFFSLDTAWRALNLPQREVVGHTFKPRTQELELGKSVSGHSCLQAEFQNGQGYTEKQCLTNKTKPTRLIFNL